MQLSLRLTALADMVTEGNRLVDVGCDHGFLPIFLVLNKKIPSALAMDVRKGPLSRAEEHIAEYGFSEKIKTRLSDGLAALKHGEGDTLVIAGMGGFLMERILTDGAELLPDFKELILQPQSDLAHFRRFIHSIGWEIAGERMIFEEGKYYPMIRVVPGDTLQVEPYNEVEEYFGRFLLMEKDPVLLKFINREMILCEDILKKLSAASADVAEQRKPEIEEKMRMLRAGLQYFD
ncbi:MAG: SAM-dependent methyltransferase [Clostridiales bacterium]|nr:SAM-dependent methyltransferase [Candidatus Blautia equi]